MIEENIASDDFTRSRLAWTDEIAVGSMRLSCARIVELLGPHLSPERQVRLREVVQRRSTRLVSVLENIYDRGNISAVMRSSEAFGFLSMHLLAAPGARFKAANRVTRGADKWLDVHVHQDPVETAQTLKTQGYKVWATDLETSTTIDELDWSQPLAVVFGNEKSGVSPEMLSLVDGRFQLPMQGFAQSFNISVAAALIFYRAHLGLRGLGESALLTPAEQEQVLAGYYLRCFDNPEALLRVKVGF